MSKKSTAAGSACFLSLGVALQHRRRHRRRRGVDGGVVLGRKVLYHYLTRLPNKVVLNLQKLIRF